MNVQDVMSPDPYAAPVDTSIRQVLRMLDEADVRHLPIVEDGALVGIVSDRDLRAFVPTSPEDFERADELQRKLDDPISTVMSADVICVRPEDDLPEVVDLMLDHRIGAVPVVESESLKLVGIVSYVDILRAARDSL